MIGLRLTPFDPGDAHCEALRLMDRTEPFEELQEAGLWRIGQNPFFYCGAKSGVADRRPSYLHWIQTF
jgi:hypothetical protein